MLTDLVQNHVRFDKDLLETLLVFGVGFTNYNRDRVDETEWFQYLVEEQTTVARLRPPDIAIPDDFNFLNVIHCKFPVHQLDVSLFEGSAVCESQGDVILREENVLRMKSSLWVAVVNLHNMTKIAYAYTSTAQMIVVEIRIFNILGTQNDETPFAALPSCTIFTFLLGLDL